MPAIENDSAVHHALTEQTVTEQIADARQRSDELFALVEPDSLYERPIAERHRIIFYVGHLEAFDWNLLHDRVFGLKSFDPEFDRLFAFGIDPIGGGLPADQPSDWPALAAVRDYVRGIRAALDAKIAAADIDSMLSTSDGFPLRTLLNVAVEHRLMHAETLAYMLHQMPFDQKVRPQESRAIVAPPFAHRSIAIPAGKVTLGLSRESNIFGWDNEFESHVVDVPSFAIDQYMVTNQQYLGFINAGGYETAAYWSDDDNREDWNWKSG
jgi:iron(II)-dependent oxidoreductase